MSPNWRRKVRSTLEPVLQSPVWQISPVCHYTDHLPCSCWGDSSLLTRHNSRPADPVHPEKTKSLLWRNFTFSSVQGQQPEGETGCRGSDRDKVHKIREIVSRNNNYNSFLPGFEACSRRTDAVWVCKLAIIFLLFQKKGSHLLGRQSCDYYYRINRLQILVIYSSLGSYKVDKLREGVGAVPGETV